MVPLIKFILTPFDRGQSWQLCLCLYHSVCINSKLLICFGPNSSLGQRVEGDTCHKTERNQTNSGRSGRDQTVKKDECGGITGKYKMKLFVGWYLLPQTDIKDSNQDSSHPHQTADMQFRQQTVLTRCKMPNWETKSKLKALIWFWWLCDNYIETTSYYPYHKIFDHSLRQTNHHIQA